MLTVLRTTGSALATKRWIWRPALGEWSKCSYQAGALFHPEEHPIASLRDLGAVLEERVSCNPRAFVVRGALAPWVRDDMAHGNGRPIHRRKLKKGDDNPSLIEVPCPWLMIDIDNFPLRPSDDLADDPESAIEHAISELLPPAFQDAEAWWQLSSSAGFSAGMLKAHVFFWLSEPADNLHIKAVLKQHAPGVDLALFNAAQPHYIAAPVIEGGHDPLPRRTGWRKGSDAAVMLPPLRTEASRRGVASFSGSIGGGVEDALALLGDGDGLQGFHVPLRTATMRYAKLCARNGSRDDDSFRETLRAAIRAATRRPDRASVDDYLADHYLQRLIDGAFALLAGDEDIQAMQPQYAAATETIETTRTILEKHINDFLERAHTWHATPAAERAEPEHAALVTSLGSGKSSLARAALPQFIAELKAAERAHRVLWTVPTHRLGGEAEEAMAELGLHVAVLRGRDADDPDASEPGVKMCLTPDTVADAITIGADVEQSVCGKPDGDCCPFFSTCAYQRQKAAVAAADVVITAHNTMFHEIPKTVTKNLALTITDESWWQIGLESSRETKLASFAEDLFGHPVLRDPNAMHGIDGRKKRRPKGRRRRQVANASATSALHELAVKAQRVFEATPEGQLVSRDAVEQSGLTAVDCALARQLEWQRKRLDVLRPGMAPDARKEAVAVAMVNATLPRRAGIWRALEDLLIGTETHTGRLEIGTRTDAAGSSRVVLLHTRRDLQEAVTAGPVLVLDATMPTRIVRHYLPRLATLAELQAVAPYLDTFQIVGGWGKTSIIPSARTSEEENCRRNRMLQELRDFVAFHSGSNALVVTYEAIEDRFSNLPGVRTGHFNKIAGLDMFGDVRSLFVIGRPLPQPEVLRHMALALTGKPVPYENPHTESRGQRMADGSGVALQVRAYADPDLEALRVAITDAEVLQAAGRGRAVNRTAMTPLALFILAGVVVPMPVKHIARWGDVRLSPQQRMAARGMVTDSPTDAWQLYPELFLSAAAAKKALQRGISGTSPYDSLFIGECPRNRITEGKYRPHGRGQQLRRMWISDWRLPTLRVEMEAVLGPLAMFLLAGCPSCASPTQEVAPDADAAAPDVLGGYGEGLTAPADVFAGEFLDTPLAGAWTVRTAHAGCPCAFWIGRVPECRNTISRRGLSYCPAA